MMTGQTGAVLEHSYVSVGSLGDPDTIVVK